MVQSKNARGRRPPATLKRNRGETLENFNLKKMIKNAGKTFSKLVKKVGALVQNIPFAPLLPLAPAMLLILKSKKIKPRGNGLKGLVQTFHESVIKGNFDFEEVENFDPVTVTAIVAAIVKYFKAIKKKKDGKTPLTDSETTALSSIGAAANALKDTAIEQGINIASSQQASEQSSSASGQVVATASALKNPLFIGIGAVVLLFVLMRK